MIRVACKLVVLLVVAGCSASPLPPTATPAPPTTEAATPTATPEPLLGSLAFAPLSDRQIPADGIAQATLVASITDLAGQPAAGRELRLSDLGGLASVSPQTQRTDAAGHVTFQVASGVAGPQTFEVTVTGQPIPLASLSVDFTRKVVVLAPGFQSALARRFQIFGPPAECSDPAQPGSITEALICLGYRPSAADDPGLGAATPGATILDMSWEPARCRPHDAVEATNCVATIGASPDGSDVTWQPSDYDLATLSLSITRQTTVDAWARRLAETLRTYDAELLATAGMHASFYLVGHSLGGEVVVRALRAIVADPALAADFEGANRGRLRLALSVDGALNWTGGIQFGAGGICGIPVRTIANEAREADNVDAVEQAFDRLGTQTVAITASSDPVVGPEVALLAEPLTPDRGYVQSIVTTVGDCGHSSLLSPEPGAPVTYPLNDLFVQYIGPAGGS